MASFRQRADDIQTLLGQAIHANLHTPGRDGNVVVLTPDIAAEVMLTGDIHGHQPNFAAIVARADLDAHPGRHLVLQEVCHGGPSYPQGGCMSHRMLEEVAALKVRYPQRVHFLLGNHELAELAEFPIRKNRQMLNMQFRLGMQQAYGEEADLVRQGYSGFLESCPLAVRLPGGIFVSHSIPERVDLQGFDLEAFRCPLEDSDYSAGSPIFELLWGRDYRDENARAFAELVGARVLITGHEPCPGGFRAPNPCQIILDCCNSMGAYLVVRTDREYSLADLLEQVQRLG